MLDNRIAYAVAVARTQSFTKAAERVGVTQSAVTKGVADLEDQLGYALFERSSRGAVPTAQGLEFVERASRLLEDARLLLRPESKVDPHAGMLRIGVCPASLEWMLTKPLGSLIRDFPSIRIQLTAASYESVIARLRDGSIDVAFGFDAAFGEWSELRRVPIGTMTASMFVRSGHPLLDLGRPITVEDITEYPFVASSDSRPYGEFIRSMYPNFGRDGSSDIHTVDFFPVVREIVQASNAIGIISKQYRPNGRFSMQFRLLDLDLLAPSHLCCAFRARWTPKRNVRAFLAVLARQFDVAVPDL